MRRASILPEDFAFRSLFAEFIDEYRRCTTYWYVPKARSLSDENVASIRAILQVVFDNYLEKLWTPTTQDELLAALKARGIVDPYNPEGAFMDRTALTRIWKKLLETLGLLYVEENKSIVVTDAGINLLASNGADDARVVIENQIAKLQYPNPSIAAGYREDFGGILPHLFLLQVLTECDNKIAVEEFELFVNLASDQKDLDRIVRYIRSWREITDSEKRTILNIVKELPMSTSRNLRLLIAEGGATRNTRISNDSAYQRALFTYPSYIKTKDESGTQFIICLRPREVQKIIAEQLKDLKITKFATLESWIAYYGTPNQRPTWYTFLTEQIEAAKSKTEAERVVAVHRTQVAKLSDEEKQEIERKKVEKAVETFYVTQLHMIETGLTLVDKGQQFETPIGRMDLLCRAASGEFVVVEIKAGQAEDSVFGQILRYIGWVHLNLAGGKNNVRGIILAGKFPEAARYSRIGLLKQDHKKFMGFKQHGLDLSHL